uniref:plexin-C1-like n=1 Tax=Epinephelus lanceolatus TaxID=310571 RepID=UPI0014474D1F|nr:plexin-C1-like [Epinephelus lanceolatus]
MILLPGLLFILWGEPGRCLEENVGFTFDGDIRHFAVANDTVYIATEERLYQLRHDLTLVQSLTQRGILKGSFQTDDAEFSRVSETDKWNATFSVNVLLPLVQEDTLISCGVIDCGYCEMLDLKNISNVQYKEHFRVGSPWRSSASVGFLVDVEETVAETYILSAIEQNEGKPTETGCSVLGAVFLHNTNNKQDGGIFSNNDKNNVNVIKRRHTDGNVEFVDGFQINSIIYLFSNLPLNQESNTIRLIWLEGKTSKRETLKSLRGATLRVSDDGKGSRLIASAVIPGGPPVLWSGVFSVDGGETNTELLLFDISPDLTGAKDADPDFCSTTVCTGRVTTPKTLKPKAVLFRQNNMTSVLAVTQKAWMVFFIGTGDGQLIKLAVGKNYHTTCPTVLYRANDDRKMFPKMHLDQVDLKHVYLSFQNQMKHVPVSKCSTYTNVQDCWSAQDPYCIWCGSKRRCTFEDNCQDSDWLSIPDDFQHKMVSHRVVKDDTDQITLNIQTHLTVGQTARANFNCQCSSSPSGFILWKNPPPQFPQCSCPLSTKTLPAEGLHITVRLRLGTTQWSHQLRLFNCSDIRGPPTSVLCRHCIEAGCDWSTNSCSWANQGVGDYSVCQKMDSGRTFARPEISSITPSVVSFYGRNHAVLSGYNLSDVIGVRIQADMDCTPQEAPVWDNTGVKLTFHIPSADNKGVVKVCVLLPDGSCHGNAKITYRSSPSCNKIAPSSTWISGKRKITLTGSHLEFVEGVMHSHAQQEIVTPRNRHSQSLTYDTPAAKTGISTSTVFLRVANETLVCSTTITYYPDPEFINFTSTRMGNDVLIIIQKKADKLEMTPAELSVWGVKDGQEYPCVMDPKRTINNTEFMCQIQGTPDDTFQHFKIAYGDKTVTLWSLSSLHHVILTVRIVLIPCVIFALVMICLWQKRLTADMKNL